MFSRLTARPAVSAIAAAALGSAALFGAATANAITPQDEQFAKVVAALGISLDSPEEAVTLGNNICSLLTQNGAQGPNPVPVVRGVVATLTNNGIERGQAVALMRAAVTVYCPEYGPLMGR